MEKPDYEGRSIVNLMSSLGKELGWKSKYKRLNLWSLNEEKEALKAKKIVLIVIDGLGNEFLKKQEDKNSFLAKYNQGAMTSVFPSTTMTAITTFMTGMGVEEHKLTGWYTYFKGLGETIKPLPYRHRTGGELWVEPEIIFDFQGLAEKSKNKKITHLAVLPQKIIRTGINQVLFKKTKIKGYQTLNGWIRQIKRAIKEKGRGYIYAYWGDFDKDNHIYGPKSKRAKKHFLILDKKIKKLVESLKGTKTTIIITGDHGFKQTPKKKAILLGKYPKIKNCLVMPLTGEPRTAYCYVKPGREKEFEKEVRKKLKGKAKLVKSEELVKKGFFGIGKTSQRLLERIGDYTLIMQKDYTIKDSVIGHEIHFHQGNHGGASKEEMLVPFILIKT